MVINALDGQRSARHPMLTGRLGNGDVYHEHVGAFQNGRRRPGVGLTRGNGIHGERSFGAKDAVGDVTGEPSINAVAVEEDGVGFGSRHGRRSGWNRVRSLEGLGFLGSLALGYSLVALVALVGSLIGSLRPSLVAFVGLAFVACRRGGIRNHGGLRNGRGRRGRRGRRGSNNRSVGLGGRHGKRRMRGDAFSL